VKYHLGASSDRTFDGNNVHLSLTANPSHLEIVDPVVLGKVRAKQDQHRCAPDNAPPSCLSSSMATRPSRVRAWWRKCLGLSGLRGHRTGGSVHFIINNQIGFTTDPRFSPLLALSVGRGQDGGGADLPRERRRPGSGGLRRQGGHRVPPALPEARGGRHVLLPPLRPQRGRRARLHPAAHVPQDRSHPSIMDLYSKKLIAEGIVTEAEFDEMKSSWRSKLDAEFDIASNYKPNKADWLDGRWSGLKAVRRIPTIPAAARPASRPSP
jgi:2-oxoglutarate dehydrogenase E1 component